MEITLGLEEELQVVDCHTQSLTPHDFERGSRDFPDRAGTSDTEIHKCALEVQTPICHSPDDIIASLSVLRETSRERAHSQGQEVLSAATHPFSRWQDQAMYGDEGEDPFYVHIHHEHRDAVRTALAFGMHVHVGLPTPQFRMEVMNSLRARLPELLLLSASSPFTAGRDTGFQSWRPSLLSHLPRMGVPEQWTSEHQYFAHISRLREVGILQENQGLWEDLRIHHRYGTLELRVMDANPSLDRIWLIVALIQAEVSTLLAELSRGQANPILPKALIEENKWRARRHGLDAKLIDWSLNTPESAINVLAKWVERIRSAALQLGTFTRIENALLQTLRDGTSSDQQRRWLLETGSYQGVVRKLVEATAQPCTQLHKA